MPLFLRSSSFAKDFGLREGINVVGRQKSCHLVLHSDMVSKSHLEIKVDGFRVLIQDMDSHNGTFLNDLKLKPLRWVEAPLRSIIRICNIEMELLSDIEVDSSSSSCFIIDSPENLTLPNLSDSHIGDSKSLSLSSLSHADQFEDQRLAALVQLTLSLRNVLQIDEVLHKSVDILLKIFTKAERVAVVVKEGTQVIPKWWRCRHDTSQSSIEISRTLVKHVMDSCDAILSSDAQIDFEQANSIHQMSVRSVMCAPLIATEGSAEGLVYLDTKQGGQFSKNDLEILAAVATQLSLAINFASMYEHALNDAILRRDVESAKQIQMQYLPAKSPELPGFDIAGFYRAARHIGGDYYDYIPLCDGRLAILLGDVAGKGVPAALTMVRLATESHACLETCQGVAEVLTRLNKRLTGMYITLVIIIIDPVSGQISISNAGHELPLLRKCDGTITEVAQSCTSCPIGVLEDEVYCESIIELGPNESLTLFSDGFPDAEAASGARLGRLELTRELAAVNGDSWHTIEHITQITERFIGTQAQFDDMCMVHIRRIESVFNSLDHTR